MKRTMNILLSVMIAIGSSLVVAAPSQRLSPIETVLPHNKMAQLRQASISTSLLANFDFETGAQGWTAEDFSLINNSFLVAQRDTFFHITGPVEEAALGAPPQNTSGQALWAGGQKTGWARPGYGNSWRQSFESADLPLSGTGIINVNFDLNMDLEAGFDSLYVQFQDLSGQWATAAAFTGQLEQASVLNIDSSLMGSVARFRFFVVTDESVSDEDGLMATNSASVLIDNLVILGAGLNFSWDFEGSNEGDLGTADGLWSAGVVGTSLGIFGALHDGATVQQNATNAPPNLTQLWGFFDDPANSNYGCGGFPGQGAIPFAQGNINFDNAIVSPVIALNQDAEGLPVPSQATHLHLLCDVYADLPYDNAVVWRYAVRSIVAGVPSSWFFSSMFISEPPYFFNALDFDISSQVTPGAESIQIALEVLDATPLPGASAACHSQGPLFDNIRLERRDTGGPTWTSVDAVADGFTHTGASPGIPFDGQSNRDALSVVVAGGLGGLDEDAPNAPAVYAHVRTTKNLSAAQLAVADGSVPSVGQSVQAAGRSWHTFRLAPVSTAFDFDLRDFADEEGGGQSPFWTPGDTVQYFFSARDAVGNTTYFHSGLSEGTTDLEAAAAVPDEFFVISDGLSILDPAPAPALMIDYDQNAVTSHAWRAAALAAGQAQSVQRFHPGPFFKRNLDVQDLIQFDQIFIEGVPTAADFDLIKQAIDQRATSGLLTGLFLGGSVMPSKLSALGTELRSAYFSFNVTATDAAALGPVSPLTAASGCGLPFSWGDCGENMILGNDNMNDVLSPTGSAQAQLEYGGVAGNTAQVGSFAGPGGIIRTVVSGYYLRDLAPADAATHLAKTLSYFTNNGTTSCLVYVDVTATGANNGTSWADAFTGLQPALSATAGSPTCGGLPYHEIWVAAGTYTPGNNRNMSFTLNNDLLLLGGFQGDETEAGQRNPSLNLTVLSGEINTPNINDNIKHVLVATSLDETCVLDGFVVTRGFADGGGNDGNGSGMFLWNSQLVLRNLTFTDNRGGNNTLGGGLYVGGFVGSSPLLENVSFIGNSAHSGGGVYVDDLSGIQISGGLMLANSANSTGGAFAAEGTAVKIINGATICFNSANLSGGIDLASTGSNIEVISLSNCIVYGNTGSSDPNIRYNGAAPTWRNSLIEGSGGAGFGSVFGVDGGGNIDADPQFTDPLGLDGLVSTGDEDLTLLGTSPCVNTGDHTLPGAPLLDLAGSVRLSGLEVDMGGYERLDLVSPVPQSLRAMALSIAPNPFNPVTSLRFELTAPGRVKLRIFDISGRLVRTLVSEELNAGPQQVIWNGLDNAQRASASGVYFALLEANGEHVAGRLALVR